MWIFHSSLYCTVPFCPSIYAYIIVTLRESIRLRERVWLVWMKNVSWILFRNISDLQGCECHACLSSPAGQHRFGY